MKWMNLKCIVKEASLKKLRNAQFVQRSRKNKTIEIVSKAVITKGVGT